MIVVDSKTGIAWGVDADGKETWLTPQDHEKEQSEWDARQETEDAKLAREQDKAFIRKQSAPRRMRD